MEFGRMQSVPSNNAGSFVFGRMQSGGISMEFGRMQSAPTGGGELG